jgi:hypothetical protein
MQELLNLVERAKKDKKKLIALKEMAVKCQDFEVAANFREMEKEFFPETGEIKSAKKQAKEIQLALQMVELNVSDDVCWLISNTLKAYSKKKGKFSIKEASELIVKRKELFNV